MNNKIAAIISAGVISAGLCALGLFIKGGIDNFAFRDRVVTVRGLAERTVDANYVTWPMHYSLAGNDLTSLHSLMTEYNDIVLSFLTDNGIDRDEIMVSPPDLYSNEGNYYGSDAPKYKYNLTVGITVATDKVDTVLALLNRQSELLTKGVAVNNSYINYEFTDLNSIKPEMIAEATRNAREAADKFAKDSNSKVGKINTAYQGQFSVESADSSTPQKKNVRVVTTIVYYLED